MSHLTKLLPLRFILMFATLGLFLGLAWSMLGTPAQAGAGLPARNTPTPGPAQDHDDDDSGGSRGPVGAYIELSLAGLPAGSWLEVQWQDSSGEWQEVEGWQGTFPASARWWVHPKDFGKGPFRWVVYKGPGGKLVGLSSPFNLPAGANQVVQVTAAEP